MPFDGWPPANLVWRILHQLWTPGCASGRAWRYDLLPVHGDALPGPPVGLSRFTPQFSWLQFCSTGFLHVAVAAQLHNPVKWPCVMHPSSVCIETLSVPASLPPLCAGPRYALLGDGLCAACLPPPAVRPTPCGRLSYALRRCSVTSRDLPVPAVIWTAALCAALAADRVQHACHHQPCTRPHAAESATHFVRAMSFAVTALCPPSCGEPPSQPL